MIEIEAKCKKDLKELNIKKAKKVEIDKLKKKYDKKIVNLRNKELGTKAYVNKHEKDYIFKDTLAVQFGFDEVIVNPDCIKFFDKELNIEGFDINLLHLPATPKEQHAFFKKKECL